MEQMYQVIWFSTQFHTLATATETYYREIATQTLPKLNTFMRFAANLK